ncbi:MAG TPA: histone-like nucleoid-structuring protein Lsr2 [Marmoricola sp.]|nr:histone-like nucleoid-structuring protein Lsr2 [Marmoricola sp.]
MRAWAREAGYQVPDRGRVSADIKAAYDAAH